MTCDKLILAPRSLCWPCVVAAVSSLYQMIIYIGPNREALLGSVTRLLPSLLCTLDVILSYSHRR